MDEYGMTPKKGTKSALLLDVIAAHPGSSLRSLSVRSGIENPSAYLSPMLKNLQVFRAHINKKFLYFVSQAEIDDFIKSGKQENCVDTDPQTEQAFNIPNLPTWGIKYGEKFRCD